MNMPLVSMNRRRRVGGIPTPIVYLNFIPSGSDGLITADSLVFKSRLDVTAEGWGIVETEVLVAPSAPSPTTPYISGGVLNGPAGIYRVVNATIVTDTEYSQTPPVSLSSLGTPGDSLTLYHLQFSSQSPDVELPPPAGLSENWNWLADGNTWTQVDARYSRSQTTVAATVLADADAPAGKAVQWGVSSAAHRWATWDDMNTYLAGRTTETVQFLVLMRLLTTTNLRGGFGYSSGSNLHTGLIAHRFSSTNHEVRVQGVGDPSGTANTSGVVGTYNDGDVIWVRAEVSGLTIKARSWLKSAGAPGSGGEPTGWTTYTAGAALNFTALGPTMRTGNPSHQVLYYSAVLNGTAPGPV